MVCDRANTMKEKTLKDIPGVGPAITRRLMEEGFDDLIAIAVASPADLAERCEISDRKAADIIQGALMLVDAGSFKTEDSVTERRRSARVLRTGSVAMDHLLDGGVHTRYLTEIYGGSERQKSLMIHQLMANATLPESRGGLDSDVIFIGSNEDRFQSSMITRIAERIGADSAEVLKRIHCSTAISSNHQILLVNKADKLAKDVGAGLLVVDSFAPHFRNEYIGRGNLAERQQMMNRHLGELREFAMSNDSVVVLTNEATGSPLKPVGEYLFAHYSAFVLRLSKEKGGKTIINLEDSPNLPESMAVIRISEDGISDDTPSQEGNMVRRAPTKKRERRN